MIVLHVDLQAKASALVQPWSKPSAKPFARPFTPNKDSWKRRCYTLAPRPIPIGWSSPLKANPSG